MNRILIAVLLATTGVAFADTNVGDPCDFMQDDRKAALENYGITLACRGDRDRYREFAAATNNPSAPLVCGKDTPEKVFVSYAFSSRKHEEISGHGSNILCVKPGYMNTEQGILNFIAMIERRNNVVGVTPLFITVLAK